MVNFIISNLFEHFDLNMLFLNYLNNHPEYFRDNFKIYGCFGNFQFCTWDGGRVFSEYNTCSIEKIKFIINSYEKFKIRPRFIFTNNQLEERDYYNRYCNESLKNCENKNIDIVLVDDKLLEYIKTNYQGYSFISSTTKCLSQFDKLKEEINNPNYSMICLDYNLNKNKKIFTLTSEEKDKCELLINAICPPGCPYRKEHYRLNSIFSLNYGKSYTMEGCKIQYNCLYPSLAFGSNNLTPDEIFNTYEPAGFKYFKIEGRTLNIIENICILVNYMVKPEYQLYVITELVSTYNAEHNIKT